MVRRATKNIVKDIPTSIPKKVVFITGAAGYVGVMLVEQLSKRDDIEKIIGLDKEACPELIKSNPKLQYIQANTSDSSWREKVSAEKPNIVIHTAWQIREMYGRKSEQWKWNVDGSDTIFNFSFSTPSVEKLIHFSTVASYGAYSDNRMEHRFTEEESFRPTDYLYAEEKRIAEDHLRRRYDEARSRGSKVKVVVIRPAAITGPRGRYMRIRFGLQAALSGQLKESAIHRMISFMVSFVPVTSKWCRQFIHEDDVTDIVELLSTSNLKSDYEIFNVCPPGPVVTGKDMAEAVNKRMFKVHPYLIRIVFFIMWHGTQGRVPTSRGGWKSYSYPIAVDGSKVTRMYGYTYKWQSKDAFIKKEGRYAKFIK